MKRATMFLIALAMVMVIGASSRAQLIIPISARTEEGQTTGSLGVYAMVVNREDEIKSGADIGNGIKYPLPAYSAGILRLNIGLTAQLDEGSFDKKTGKFRGKLKVAFENQKPHEPNYVGDNVNDKWDFDIPLRGIGPGVFNIDFQAIYKAGRKRNIVDFFLLTITWAKAATQQVGASARIMVVEGAPKNLDWLQYWQKAYLRHTADGIDSYMFSEEEMCYYLSRMDIALPKELKTQVGEAEKAEAQVEAVQPATQPTTTTTTETRTEEPAYKFTFTEKPSIGKSCKLSAIRPISVLIDYQRPTSLSFGGTLKSVQTIQRSLESGGNIIFPIKSDVVFTITDDTGKKQSFNEAGEVLR